MTDRPSYVLIVEDEPSIALSLRFLLEQEGYRVAVAEDGEAALAACREAPPDVVLLDVMLPGISGFEVCQQLKSATRGVKVVLVTARGREADLEKGKAVGADAYIVKPFAIRDVLKTVRGLLNRSEEAEGS